MFLCCNVACACAARGNVHSCGTSRAHSSCDTRDTLLWGHSLGHLALIRTPGIPWLMRSLVGCDSPNPLLSLEAPGCLKQQQDHICGTYAKHIALIYGHWTLDNIQRTLSTHELVHGLRIGFSQRQGARLKKWETDEGNGRSWGKITSGLGQRFAGDEKMFLSNSTK